MKTMFKITFFAVLTAFLLPVAGFAIRGAFPFNKPEFKGLTYYQLAEWRWWDFERLRAERGETEKTYCFEIDYGVSVPYIPVQSFGYTVAGLQGQKPDPMHGIPENVTYANFPAKWWDTAEFLLWFNLDQRGKMPDRACWSGNNVPSAEEFDETIAALQARVAELDEILSKQQASK